MMPYTRTDKVTLAILDSRWFQRLRLLIGAPDASVRMPKRRLPDGRTGFRVLTIRVRP